jgi:hypothetical protein
MESSTITTLTSTAGMDAIGTPTAPAFSDVLRAATGDSAELSAAGRFLAGQRLAKASLSSSSVEKVSFSLQYTATREETVSASGILSRRTATLDVNFSYEFSREVMVDGAMVRKNFRLQMTISSASVRQITASPLHMKEDIVHFLRRVVDDVFEYGRDRDSKVGGVVFRSDDLAELSSLEHGKILKYLHALLVTLQMIAARREAADGRRLPSLLLTPQREETEGAAVESASASTLSVHLDMRELSVAIGAPSQVKSPAPVTPEAPAPL